MGSQNSSFKVLIFTIIMLYGGPLLLIDSNDATTMKLLTDLDVPGAVLNWCFNGRKEEKGASSQNSTPCTLLHPVTCVQKGLTFIIKSGPRSSNTQNISQKEKCWIQPASNSEVEEGWWKKL